MMINNGYSSNFNIGQNYTSNTSPYMNQSGSMNQGMYGYNNSQMMDLRVILANLLQELNSMMDMGQGMSPGQPGGMTPTPMGIEPSNTGPGVTTSAPTNNSPVSAPQPPQIRNGTRGSDNVILHANGSETFNGNGGHDTVTQSGGRGNDRKEIRTESGHDYIHQYGGEISNTNNSMTEAELDAAWAETDQAEDGNDRLITNSGAGDDEVRQMSGGGDDELFANGEEGDDLLKQWGGTGNDSLTAVGGSGNNTIHQEGGVGNDQVNYSSGVFAGDDVVDQSGGQGDDNVVVNSQNGNDYIHQYGGEIAEIDDTMTQAELDAIWAATDRAQDGNDRLETNSGGGDDEVRQMSGGGDDVLIANGGDGDDLLKQWGGTGNDNLSANGGAGNDTVIQDGGEGDDKVSYTVSSGNDNVEITGGEGTDSAAITVNGDDVVRVVTADGRTVYSQGEWVEDGNDQTLITLDSTETYSINNTDGEVIASGLVPTGPKGGEAGDGGFYHSELIGSTKKGQGLAAQATAATPSPSGSSQVASVGQSALAAGMGSVAGGGDWVRAQV